MELSTGISIITILISFLACYYTRYIFKQTYRPIISAEIVTHASGNGGILFDIVVYNTGNRPAINVCLTIDKKYDIDKSFVLGASEKLVKEVKACLSDEGKISLLGIGESKSNGFADSKTLTYGTKMPICLIYKDLNQRKFKSFQELIVKDSSYFAGSGWQKKNNL